MKSFIPQPSVTIRTELSEDLTVVRDINLQAFGSAAEADLVDALRSSGCTFISLIAEMSTEVVGHLLFTPVELLPQHSRLRLVGLAPMAVLPDFQNQGVGSTLLKKGLEQLKSEDYDAVVVIGHSNFYTRFGFVPSTHYGIKSEYDVPEDVFMVRELTPAALRGHTGTIRYHDAFGNV
ncbi:MAG: N-acetyltransferase [Pseudomonadota bacterium]